MNKDRFDLSKIKVHRTKEGTVFEIVCTVLLVALWVLAVVLWRRSTPTIATHFDWAGRPDGFGSRNNLFLMAAMGTLATLLALAAAYRPQLISLPVRIRNVRQLTSAIRMVRILAVGIALLFIAIVFSMGFPGTFPATIFGPVLLIVIAYYTYTIYRQK